MLVITNIGDMTMKNMRDYIQNLDEEKLNFIHKIQTAYENKELTLEEAQKQLKEKYQSVSAEEIAVIEQYKTEQKDDECLKKDIQGMLDLFFGLIDTSRPKLPEDHPISRYYQENDALLKILLEIEDLVQYPIIKNQWYEIYDRLFEYKKHLSRKQNQLYSVLEKKGFDRPTTTMWTLDDFVYDEIKNGKKLLDDGNEEEFIHQQTIIIEDIKDLISKEESVLYPTAIAMIRDTEFEEMKEGDQEIGYAWISVSSSPQQHQKESSTSNFQSELSSLLNKYGYSVGNHEKLDVKTGKLSLEQINLIYQHMPVDISYVDENELVCFYTDTKHRVFPRSKNVIGRDVKNCHPKKSVHIVEEIIEKFRSGEQDHAEFWINKPGVFIYIYYVAVKDENGKFRGVLEMMQDCTHIRSLEGSQTLLTWSNAQTQQVAEEIEEVPENTNIFEGEIDENTKLSSLLESYPRLKEKLPEISEKFKMIQTPLGRVMMPKATIKVMSERTGISIEELIIKLKEKIAELN